MDAAFIEKFKKDIPDTENCHDEQVYHLFIEVSQYLTLQKEKGLSDEIKDMFGLIGKHRPLLAQRKMDSPSPLWQEAQKFWESEQEQKRASQ